MARSMDAVNDSIRWTASAAAIVMEQSSGSQSGWFKTSDSGTTRLVIYNEGASGGSGWVNLFIALNDGTNGQLRVFRRNANGTNLVSLAGGSGLADGAWHFYTYSWTSLSDHFLYVDGVQVDSDTTTDLSGDLLTGVDYLRIGERRWAASQDNQWLGEVADIFNNNTALTLAEHTQLYNKTKNAVNIKGMADLRFYCPLHKSFDDSDLRDVAQNQSNTAATNATANVDGPDGFKPTGMQLSTPDKAYIFNVNEDSQILYSDTDLSHTYHVDIREPGNVIFDGKNYKLYYTGNASTYNGGNAAIFLAEATDARGPWTIYGLVIANATLPSEDPHVVYVNGTYYLYAENKNGGTNQGISVFTSSDGYTWSLQDATCIDHGGIGDFDETQTGSPTVWYEDGTFYMLYEGTDSGGDREIGLATSANGTTWSKSGSNPVITLADTQFSQYIEPYDIFKKDGTYYLFISGTNDGTNWFPALMTSTDRITWTQDPTTALAFSELGFGFMLAGSTGYGYYQDTGANNVYEIQFYGDGISRNELAPIFAKLISKSSVGVGVF